MVRTGTFKRGVGRRSIYDEYSESEEDAEDELSGRWSAFEVKGELEDGGVCT